MRAWCYRAGIACGLGIGGFCAIGAIDLQQGEWTSALCNYVLSLSWCLWTREEYRRLQGVDGANP